MFAFHALPDAFTRLTPAWAHTRVIEHARSLDVGSRTIVRIRVLPFVWIRGEFVHTVCEPPVLFVDEQARGPFRSWQHRHVMAPVDGGTLLVDEIAFEPPFGLLGRLAAPLIVLPRLRRLFAYRHEVTRAWCEGESSAERAG